MDHDLKISNVPANIMNTSNRGQSTRDSSPGCFGVGFKFLTINFHVNKYHKGPQNQTEFFGKVKKMCWLDAVTERRVQWQEFLKSVMLLRVALMQGPS
jgi:hypothetical protein